MTERPQENLETIRRVLSDDYLELAIERLTFEENFDRELSKVSVDTVTTGGEKICVEGEGVGAIDALTNGLLGRFAAEYQSLNTIAFTGFSVHADFDSKEQHAGSDAVGKVSLEVQNSEKGSFTFSDASRSIVASAAKAVLAAIEYFVNAERAFILLHRALKDAQSRKRSDLVRRYTRELSEVAKSTSYAEVIEQIRAEALKHE